MPRLFFFRPTTNKPSKSDPIHSPNSSTRGGPRLDRCNAAKHFDYDASTTSSSFSSSATAASALEDSSLRVRSLDIDKTSFRVEGGEGEIESILKKLGLSGIEDFAIPADAWEARKVRSVSDVVPRSRLTWTDSFREEGNEKVKDEEREVIVGDELGGARVLTGLTTGGCGWRPEDSSARVDVVELRRAGHELCSGANGIRGSRPAMLRPPPSMRLPVIDNTCSTWDLLRDFAPVEGEGLLARESRFPPSWDEDDDEEEEVEAVVGTKTESAMAMRERDRGIRVGETEVLSTSCSFSTSNDDDSSSSTSNVSPNMRVRRTISYWEKGHLLGRGSFGSVYEGIAE